MLHVQNGNHDKNDEATTTATTNTWNDRWGIKTQLQSCLNLRYFFLLFLSILMIIPDRLGLCVYHKNKRDNKHLRATIAHPSKSLLNSSHQTAYLKMLVLTSNLALVSYLLLFCAYFYDTCTTVHWLISHEFYVVCHWCKVRVCIGK